MKYKLKPVPVADEFIDAILFEYSDTGMQELKEFVGAALIGYTRARSPYAIGYAEIVWFSDQPKSVLLIAEGCFLIKKKTIEDVVYYDTLSVWEFTKRYEPVV